MQANCANQFLFNGSCVGFGCDSLTSGQSTHSWRSSVPSSASRSGLRRKCALKATTVRVPGCAVQTNRANQSLIHGSCVRVGCDSLTHGRTAHSWRSSVPSATSRSRLRRKCALKATTATVSGCAVQENSAKQGASSAVPAWDSAATR